MFLFVVLMVYSYLCFRWIDYTGFYVIITRYLVKAVLRNQFIILFVLFVVFFCQKLMQILSVSIDNSVPIRHMFLFVLFGLLEVLKLILPFSLFLGLLITLKKLCVRHEIIAMYACGLGNIFIFRAALILSGLTVIFLIVNIIWISPWSSYCCSELLLNLKYRFDVASIIGGKFYHLRDNCLIFFINRVNKNICKDIFIIRFKSSGICKVISLVVAETGCITRQIDGVMSFILNKGIYYEYCDDIGVSCRNICITNFLTHQILLHYDGEYNKPHSIEQMSIGQLWNMDTIEANAELHWRFILIVSVLVMAVLAVALSVNYLQYSYFLCVFLGIILCLVFFLLQISLRFYAINGSYVCIKYLMWLVSILYFVFAYIFIFNDYFYIKFCKLSLFIRGKS